MPLISDQRFAPDTLFLVAEEDWRLWKADCKQGEKLAPEDLPEDRQEELSAPSGSQDAYPAVRSFSDVTASSSQPTKGKGKATLKSWGRPTKAKPAEVQQTSQELLDILHMCNVAHRAGKGDVVWLSYNTRANQRWCPSYGSTLLAVSARGGRILHDNWQEWFKEPMHWDIALKEVLMELSAQSILPASYVFPSVGGFDEHISAFMNSKKCVVRECNWDCNAIQEGTRELDGDGRAFSRVAPWQKYQLKEFPLEQKYRATMEVVIVPEIPTRPLDDPDVWWTGAATVDSSFYDVQKRGKGSSNKMHTKDSGAARSFQPSKRVGSPTRQLPWKWQRLYGSDRAQHKSVSDKEASEIKISQEQTWHPLEQSEFQTTNSQRRMRAVVSNFERRFFTNDPSKVGTHSGKLFRSAHTYELSAIYFSDTWTST